MIAEYEVKGMSCERCINSVTSELTQLVGVTGVDIDLTSGLVKVSTTHPLDEAQVRAAVDEAGYDLIGSAH